MRIFDSNRVFYTFQEISHRLRRKKNFRPPKNFPSPRMRKKFLKKIKMRIFDSKQVFYTFQVISHRLRRKNFFRPPKNFLSPRKSDFGVGEPTSKSHKSKTRSKFKNLARAFLDIALKFQKPQAIPESEVKWEAR